MENTSAFINRDEKIKILPLYITETLDETLPANRQLEVTSTRYAFICCTQGKLHMEDEEKCVNLSSEMGILCCKNKKYRFCADLGGCRLKIIVFDGSGVEQIMTYFGLRHMMVFGLDLQRFEFDYRHISFNVKMQYGYRAALDFQQIIYEIFSSRVISGPSKNMEILNRYIMENYCSDIDVNKLAEVYGTSVSYLCRAFKEEFHVSPIAYVNTLRVKKAKNLLQSTQKKVAQIARECGFINAEYFCYVFKKHENCTPLQYRKNYSIFMDSALDAEREIGNNSHNKKALDVGKL